ncbi:MAG: molecular chaperone [Bryobacteraceae bacterium]
MSIYSNALILGCLACTSLLAGSFNVSPVRVELSARQPSASIAVRNVTDEPSVVQVSALRWTPKGNGEEYRDTDDILLNPPIFSLAPGQVQYVRLGLRRPSATAVEVSYRLVLEEVPPPAKAGFSGVTPLLQIRIPAFVAPAGKTAPELNWSFNGSEAKWKLTVSNRGNIHVQIKRLILTGESHDGGGAQRTSEMNVYVLSGGTHEWDLDTHAFAAGPVSLSALTDHGEIHVQLEKDVP